MRLRLTILALVSSLRACVPDAYSQPQNPEIYRAALTREAQLRFGIPAPVPAIAGQITQESAWNPLAGSPVGAQGLMQFMPSTAQWAAVQGGFGAVDAFNPIWSIRAGVWYDRWLYDRIAKYESDCDRWHFALSAYNGGLGWVNRRQARSPAPGNWSVTGKINPGITPGNQHENETYSERIIYKHQPRFTSWGKTTCSV